MSGAAADDLMVFGGSAGVLTLPWELSAEQVAEFVETWDRVSRRPWLPVMGPPAIAVNLNPHVASADSLWESAGWLIAPDAPGWQMPSRRRWWQVWRRG